MVRSPALLLVLFAALAPPALAAEATIVTREVPLRGERELSAAAPERFDLVGLHWQGSGSVSFRTKGPSGRWSAWRAAAPEAEDAPDPGSHERRAARWRVGNPYWVGGATGIEYRLRGRVRRLRAHFVRSPETAVPPRTLAIAESPAIVPRTAWRANESIRRDGPRYATSLRFAVVHHTAGGNGYSPAQSAAVVRAIQLYHVRGNGWDDIGYNLLVDRYGQVFEGRFGGVDRNVIGAHAEGFNVGSVGVAVLGNYDGSGITAAARTALIHAISWRLDVAHVDPASTLTFQSGGNARFPRGLQVPLRGVVGHRDTGFTSCPGNALYAVLGRLRGEIAGAGGPKLFSPSVQGTLGGPVRFRARLSESLPWTVTVTDALGRPVTSGSGTGTAVDWVWDATTAVPGTYSYSIAAGPLVRPASGTIGARPAALTLTSVVASPSAVTPNGDGRDDVATIGYRLSTAATVTATLTDAAGVPLSMLFTGPRAAGSHRFTFTAEGVPDGIYRILITAVGAGGRTVSATVQLLVNRTLSSFAAAPLVVSPNGDGRLDRIAFTFALATPVTAQLRIMRPGLPLTVFDGALNPGQQTLPWDVTDGGVPLRDGAYDAELTVTDAVGSLAQRVRFRIDTRAPVVRLLSRAPLRLRVGEPALVTMSSRGRRRTVRVQRAKTLVIPWPARGAVRIVAEDLAGNRTTVTR